MHEIRFIQDMAIIMLVAGFSTIVFHQLKQPVVLGYIIAGIAIGPYTPPFGLVYDENTVKLFAELGVIFLMFSLGLEFSLRKLKSVGISALVASLTEMIVMIGIGYGIGRFFNWNPIDSLFLGAILAISSTTIIVKVLSDLHLQKKKFAQLIFGILIVEDILGIAILALLSGLASTHTISPVDFMITIGKLILFLVVSFSLGILTIPRLLSYVAKFKSQEMLLISVLGVCFGFCLLVIKLNYSIVLGAFIIGAIIAESDKQEEIEKLIIPLRDMFSAMFFVAIGMMLNPALLLPYLWPIVIITLAVIIGKVLTCSFGAFITGQNGKTSLRIGMGLAQIGEFSFIIASLGMSLKMTSDFLFPITIGVSMITTMTTPYLIKCSDKLSTGINRFMPEGLKEIFQIYTLWLQNIQLMGSDPSALTKAVRRSLFIIFINFTFITTIFLVISYLASNWIYSFVPMISPHLYKTISWGTALLLSLPFLIAVYRKIKALSMVLAEFSVRQHVIGRFTLPVRKIISELIPIFSIIAIMLFISTLSASILPPRELLIFVIIIACIITILLFRWFVKLHSKLQIDMINVMEKNKKPENK